VTCIVLSKLKFSSSCCKRSNPISNDNRFLTPLITPNFHNYDVIGEFKVPVESQNGTQLSANGTKGVEIRKSEMSFAPQWTHGNLPVRNPNVGEWH